MNIKILKSYLPIPNILGLSLILILTGCGTRYQTKELVGSYVVTYPHGIERLNLIKDGTYQQNYIVNDSKLTVTNSGIWKLVDEKEIHLLRPMICDDGFGRQGNCKIVDGYWPIQIQKAWGKIILPINEDLGFKFKKIGS